MDAQALHHRARTSGVNPLIYRIVRMVLVPFFKLYFRQEKHGREHLPATGGLIIAANHRSFLDPFVIGAMLKRPVYYVAKRELFERRWQGWILNALGAFPVARGTGDADMIALARTILYDPRWPWHAAAHLGGTVKAPNQYLRSQPRQYKDLFEG